MLKFWYTFHAINVIASKLDIWIKLVDCGLCPHLPQGEKLWSKCGVEMRGPQALQMPVQDSDNWGG